MKRIKTNVIFNEEQIYTEDAVPESIADLTDGNSRLAQKQDVLTAGHNITIEDNVICAEVPSILNSKSNSQTDAYSSKYVDDNFVPISFTSKLYLKKTTNTTATIEDTKPTTSASNYMTTTTTNTSFDWSSPMLTLTRTLETQIVLNATNSFSIDLYFESNRQVNLTFGAKVKISTDNGSTWSYISSNQDFGAKSYISGLNNDDIVVYCDALTTPTTYDIGTLLAIEIFTKQGASTSLTLDYYCGITINSADIYSFLEFNFLNTNINTNQIEDGAITYDKLDSDLQSKIDSIDTKADKTTSAVYTLSSASWSLNQQTISITSKNSSNNARVSPAQSWSGATDTDVLANQTAISDANIYRIIDNGTSLTFVCETTPTTDLKILVEVFE